VVTVQRSHCRRYPWLCELGNFTGKGDKDMADQTKRCGTERNTYLELTPGQFLLIWRNRKGWNQDKAAQYFKISLHQYKMAEYDKNPEFPFWKISDFNPVLSNSEECLILRRQSGKLQWEVAQEVGLSRNAYRAQETGQTPCNKLLEYWDNV
jgi:hypothetical protein